MALGRVEAIPTHELVLEQLRRSIHLGHFVPGDKLPTERELASQLGVSRMTVREAVRVLATEELVEIRRGSSGGITVRERRADRAELRRRLREFEDLLDFRIAVEASAARLAALRRTKADALALRRAFSRLEAIVSEATLATSVSEWMRADSDYHLLIARIARNERLALAIEDARAGMFLPIGAVWGRIENRAHDMHAEVTEAICDGDAPAAFAAMTAHLEATREDIHAIVHAR